MERPKQLSGTLELVAAVMAAQAAKHHRMVIRHTSDSKQGRRMTAAKGSKFADLNIPNTSEDQRKWNTEIEKQAKLKRILKFNRQSNLDRN